MTEPPPIDAGLLSAVLDAVRGALASGGHRPLVLGICGAQGSGKSTLARALVDAMTREGLAAAALSIDDLYLTRAERERLGREVHPLLRTRGPPGTHDIALGLATLAALGRGEPAALPRFDKAADDRCPQDDWPRAPAGCAVLVLEGWCVGARPQADVALAAPVNALEADEDPDGIWRGHANAALAGPYRPLFARIDLLLLLAAPGFDVVHRWRAQQEAELRLSAGPGAPGVMDEAAIVRFIAHYERLTRHILAEMPGRADVVVRLGEAREVLAISLKAAAGSR